MQLKIKDSKNAEQGSVKLPIQFSEEFRADLVSRAVHAIQSHKRQPYGADPEAGKKSSAELSRRRRKYRGSYGFGISRVPRKILSRRGTRMMWVGAFAPGTVGGRRAHAPKAEKIWSMKINDKERQKAIRSAMAATVNSEMVLARGHKVPDSYPFAIADDFQSLAKTKDVQSALEALGFEAELDRASVKKVRAGKGKMRGRKYQRKTGLLIVVSEECALANAAKNVAGIDVVEVANLNAELLAPGTDAGRATLFTKGALEKLEKENLFFSKIKEHKVKVTVTKSQADKAEKVIAEKKAKKSE